MSHKRPEDQTVEEWLHDYITSPDIHGKKLNDREQQHPRQTNIMSPLQENPLSVKIPEPPPDNQAFTQDTANTLVGEFRYTEHWTFHKTRKTGSLSLVFSYVESGEVASMFFNVDLRKYPQGKHGQFIPPELGKFRAFWNKCVGEPPSQWSRAYYGLRKLKNMRLFGTAKLKHKETGETYWELIELDQKGLLDVSTSA